MTNWVAANGRSHPRQRFSGYDLKAHLFRVANNQQFSGDTDLFTNQDFVQIVNAANRRVIECDDDIAFVQSGSLRWTGCFYRHHQDPRFQRQIVKSNQATMERHILNSHADVAASDFYVTDQPAGHKFGRVARNREADALRRPNHRRIHADDFASRIHQWPARIARIQGGICLNDVIDQTTGLRMHGSAEGADYSRSHTRLETERIA